jgi:S1-C subfamily serine protease
VPALQELQEAIRGAAEAAGDAVVGVGQRWGVGSGVVLTGGKVLTNAHNIREEPVTVTLRDGRAVEAQVAGIDPDGDLAVLDADTGDASPLPWADEAPGVGSAVVALANPGGRGLRATLGFVSGVERSFRGPRGRRIAGSIEHTAPLPRGSSGGPVIDAEGRLVGINTNRMGDGFYLAIPADESLRQRVDALSRGQSVSPVRLGIAVAPPRVARRLRRAVGLPERDGLLVQAVEEGSPAEGSGLQRGDLIVEAESRPMTSPDDLHTILETGGPEGSVSLKVIRGSEERTVSVSLGADRAAGTRPENV